jgi:hypothetical protein
MDPATALSALNIASISVYLLFAVAFMLFKRLPSPQRYLYSFIVCYLSAAFDVLVIAVTYHYRHDFKANTMDIVFLVVFIAYGIKDTIKYINEKACKVQQAA